MDASTWVPVVSLVLGYAVKSVEDWVQNGRTLTREREARLAARRDQRAASRIVFQRETLLQLQEAAQKLARATGRAHYLDLMAHRKSNEWHKELLPQDLDDELLAGQTQTSLLTSRVRDDKVRALANQFRSAAVASVDAQSEADASRSLRQAIAAHQELSDRIGEVIRSIDEDEG